MRIPRDTGRWSRQNGHREGAAKRAQGGSRKKGSGREPQKGGRDLGREDAALCKQGSRAECAHTLAPCLRSFPLLAFSPARLRSLPALPPSYALSRPTPTRSFPSAPSSSAPLSISLVRAEPRAVVPHPRRISSAHPPPFLLLAPLRALPLLFPRSPRALSLPPAPSPLFPLLSPLRVLPLPFPRSPRALSSRAFPSSRAFTALPAALSFARSSAPVSALSSCAFLARFPFLPRLHRSSRCSLLCELFRCRFPFLPRLHRTSRAFTALPAARSFARSSAPVSALSSRSSAPVSPPSARSSAPVSPPSARAFPPSASRASYRVSFSTYLLGGEGGACGVLAAAEVHVGELDDLEGSVGAHGEARRLRDRRRGDDRRHQNAHRCEARHRAVCELRELRRDLRAERGE